MLIDGFEKGPLKYIYMHARFGQEALPGMTLHAQDMCFFGQHNRTRWRPEVFISPTILCISKIVFIPECPKMPR